MGVCYTATQPVGALIEALQAWLTNLPVDELSIRRLAAIRTPDDAPAAAKLTSQSGAGEHGITAALGAGAERPRTQAWAAAFRRDGWWALYGGVKHDPSGRLRGHALFDHDGAHPPSYGQPWPHETATIHDDGELFADLASFGIHVHEAGELPFRDLQA